MDANDTGFSLDAFRLSRRGHTTNYKRKLAQKRTLRRLPTEAPGADVASPLAEQVRALADDAGVDGAAFQCVAVAALQTLDRAGRRERRAAEAALSLAQRQMLDAMVEEVDEAAAALRQTLNAQGARLLDRDAPTRRPDETPEHSWWFALSEAVEVLEEGAAWIRSIAAGQPQDGPTHRLSRLVARLLHRHHDALFAEAEQWLG